MRIEFRHHQIALACFAALSAACVADVAGTDRPQGDDVTFGDHVHAMPVQSSGVHPLALTSAHLTYYGGKVVQNASVVQVLYGSGTYISQLNASGPGSMAGFYQQTASVGVYDWLSEYNTSSPSQAIGRGALAQQKQISPTAAHNGSTITDASIQAELATQIGNGTLTPANDNTIYMVHFPAGKTITDPSGSASCSVFCAYHGTFKIGAQNVYYGVMPDMTGACASGCGSAPTTFANQTSVASHELIETITDAEVGLSTVVGPPLAWYDSTNGEIGDICNASQGTFAGADGVTYTVQKEWSNQQNACITTRATQTTPDFGVAVSPSSATVTPGSSTSFSVSTSAIGGSTQSIALTATGLPSGVTGSFSPSSVTAGSTSTLTLTAASTAASTTATFTVKGTSGATSHTASASLTVGTGGGGGGTTVLTNNVAVTGLSGATNAQANFVIAVPAGQTTLTVTLSGGTGDADLYVRASTAPTLTTYDCRPYLTGNGETCSFTNPAAGNWYIMLNGYAAYSGASLKASYSGGTTDTTPALGNNAPVTGISGATSSQQFWKLTVPAGQTQVVFSISGGTGDADLYVRKGSKPTTSTFDCRPYLTGNSETCTFSNPTATDYYVLLRGYAAFTGVTLVGHYP
jgi:serine protease